MKRSDWRYDEQKTRLGDPLVADQYHFRQARTIFLEGNHENFTIHDYLIRKTSFGSYLLVSGIERVIKNLRNLRFTEEDIEGVKLVDPLSAKPEAEDYLEYLRNLKFKGDLWVVQEGDVVFPNEPIIRIEGNWLETWIIESMILKSMNYASLVATYASQVVTAAKGRSVADFGLRRSPGDGAGIDSARAAFIGGAQSTSNVRAAVNLDIKASGTMSHEFVQGYSVLAGSEVNAFVIFGKRNPDSRIYLLDTFDVARGVENAIKATEIIGEPAKAVRIDSGNLGELAKMVRGMDREKKKFTGIILTSDLDVARIKEILDANVPVTGFGIGTKMTAPSNPSALGGVYKLVAIKKGKELVPTLKISGDAEKTTLPGKKNIWRGKQDGKFIGDVIALVEEKKPDRNFEPVLVRAIRKGKLLMAPRSLEDIQRFARENISMLPEKCVKVIPDPYPVKISKKLRDLRQRLIEEAKSV